MPSPPNSLTTPAKRAALSAQAQHHEGGAQSQQGEDVMRSLNKLSLSTSPSTATATASNQPVPARSPSASYRPAVDRSPSALSVRSASRMSSTSTRDSRSATPTLLRKASMKSLQSSNGVAPPRRTPSSNVPPSPASPDPSSAAALAAAAASASSRSSQPSANSIARAHFRAELEQLHVDQSGRSTETVVLLHDSCYGHRYSRPKTSRAALSSVVERPERIKACLLGVATAYVLLGERHADGEHHPHPDAKVANIPSIPFRITKSTRRLPLLSPAVTNVHGTKWMEELKIMCESAEGKLAMGGKELQRPEMNHHHGQEPPKLHEGDLYLCGESREAIEGSLGAVCDAVDAVFKPGGGAPKRAFVAVRPPGHHCSADYPSGFCWINNVHVGIMHAILGHGLTHAAIIDFDLHHGDGSQAIAWQHNARGVGLAKNAAYWKKASIGYFSLHDINSYPCEQGDEEKVKNASLCIDSAHGQHVWNVHLEPWKTEAEFWQLYHDKYAVLLQKARKFLKGHAERLRAANQTSKAAIFLSAGFDASEWEGAGMQRHSVNVPTGFYARIARDVTKIAEEEGTGVDGRLISVLEGGYSDRALTSGVLSHISGLAGSDAAPASQRNDLTGGTTAAAAGEALWNTAATGRRNSLELKLRPHAYDPSWWSSESLEMLETGVVLTPPPPRAIRSFTPGNYSTPTQASTAKMVEVAKLRRQASVNGLQVPVAKPPTPPPPEVSWIVAAHGLATVLTPTERTTTSCSPQELTAEATRVRREKHMALVDISEDQPVPAVEVAPSAATNTPAAQPPSQSTVQQPSRMSLRERKAVKSYFEGSDEDDKESQRKSRRRTAPGGSAAVLSSNSGNNPALLQADSKNNKTVRRLSVASSTVDGASDDSRPLAVAGGRSSTAVSSGTARPGTSMSVRTAASATAATTSTAMTGNTNPALVVKKTRAGNTNKANSSASKVSKASKKTPEAGAPNNINGAKSSSTSPTQVQQPTSEGTTSIQDPTGDALDKITTGIKKITLVTKQQKEARAKKAEARVGVSPKASRRDGDVASQDAHQLVTPKDEADEVQKHQPIVTESSSSSGWAAQEETSPPQAEAASSPSTTTAPAPVQQDNDRVVHTPSASPVPSQAATMTSATTPDMSVPNHDHSLQPSPQQVHQCTQEQPLKWLPTSKTTIGVATTPPSRSLKKQEGDETSPSTMNAYSSPPPPPVAGVLSPSLMKPGDLPVFTASSQLRFASPSSSSPRHVTADAGAELAVKQEKEENKEDKMEL